MPSSPVIGRDTVLRSLRNKFRKSLRARGILGTALFLPVRVVRAMADLSPGRRAMARRKREEDERFDRQYGVDTGGVIPLSGLRVTAETWIYGNAYEAVSGHVSFAGLLDDLRIRYEDFVFIDLGSGKGRAVLLASMLPFKAVIGVEFAEELHRVAEDNARRWPRPLVRCSNMEFVCADATSYAFPEHPLVLFMYNPFARPVMEIVVRNVCVALRRNPRRVIVLYFTPKHTDIWERTGLWKTVKTAPGVHVFDTATGDESAGVRMPTIGEPDLTSSRRIH